MIFVPFSCGKRSVELTPIGCADGAGDTARGHGQHTAVADRREDKQTDAGLDFDLALDEAPVEQPDGLGGRCTRKPSRVLAPGMVVTLEPGLYVRPGPDVDERWWHIGIRIEDDAIVTDAGCELISRGVPVCADDIEALMQA